AKSRLGIEGVRLQNKSWGSCWKLLRVAASSNPALNTDGAHKAAQRRLALRYALTVCYEI
ncbi:hypothetical protein, partial [Rhodoferax antarcticus]|uniref:hypothetical protein n=1 Tax=Rhodoferax antarcticus TaxID=81479 RepID=UPI0022255374